jgi:prevent-host-death family protein
MTTLPVRELARHTAEVIDRVASGERIEITRNGRLVAVLMPPAVEQVVYSELVSAGRLTPGRGGLATWTPRSGRRPDDHPLPVGLPELRPEADR